MAEVRLKPRLAGDLQAGDVVHRDDRYLRIKHVSDEPEYVDITFTNGANTRIKKHETVGVYRGSWARYVDEDGRIDYRQWAEDHDEPLRGDIA